MHTHLPTHPAYSPQQTTYDRWYFARSTNYCQLISSEEQVRIDLAGGATDPTSVWRLAPLEQACGCSTQWSMAARGVALAIFSFPANAEDRDTEQRLSL